jgi:predicted dehydrogenase
MMKTERPDFVCISLWPHLHAKAVLDVVPFGPKGIFCEKPMDVNWDAALAMHEACKKAGVALGINHQRRFNKPFLRARALIDEGAVGDIQRLETAWHNLSDSGTHWLDMLFYFNHETPAEWVLAQVERSGARQVFGAWQETQAVVTFHCKNGVRATMFAGKDHADLGCMIRVIGTKGTLEILDKAPWLRIHRLDQPGWQELDPGEGIHDNAAILRGVADFVESIEQGKTALLSSDNALRGTEIIFAAFESSARRGRVELPLPPGPSALLTMLEADRAKL